MHILESASKTATMLTNAIIAEEQISVEYYFKEEYADDHRASNDSESTDGNMSQEEKVPKQHVNIIIYYCY